jgi:hypothetical protein
VIWLRQRAICPVFTPWPSFVALWSGSVQFVAKRAIAIIVLGAALAPVVAGAQAVPQRGANEAADPATPANGAVKHLTGKERLGEKWEDEQRVDNCKVPFDKRGTKPRPDSCTHAN